MLPEAPSERGTLPTAIEPKGQTARAVWCGNGVRATRPCRAHSAGGRMVFGGSRDGRRPAETVCRRLDRGGVEVGWRKVGCEAGHSGPVESELARVLLATGGVAVARYVRWIVDGNSEPQVFIDMSWPAAPLLL